MIYEWRLRREALPVGRFPTRGPVGHLGGINLYSYVASRVANNIDPNATNPPAHTIVGAGAVAELYLHTHATDLPRLIK